MKSKPKSKPLKTITQRLTDRRLINAAMAQAAKEARRQHRLSGHPLVVWKNGKTVLIPAKDIPE